MITITITILLPLQYHHYCHNYYRIYIYYYYYYYHKDYQNYDYDYNYYTTTTTTVSWLVSQLLPHIVKRSATVLIIVHLVRDVLISTVAGLLTKVLQKPATTCGSRDFRLLLDICACSRDGLIWCFCSHWQRLNVNLNISSWTVRLTRKCGTWTRAWLFVSSTLWGSNPRQFL